MNPTAYKGVIAVPSEIIRGIKLLSPAQLKVILAVCASAADGFDEKTISAMTGIPESDALDCLIFWEEKGIITGSLSSVQIAVNAQPENNTEAAQTADKTAEEKTEQKAEPEKDFTLNVKAEKLTRVEIAQRVNSSKDIAQLLNNVQQELGRPIGLNDQSIIVNLHDYYGLKTEIILLLCVHARMQGKANNMNYINNLGVNWSKREIDTLEAAHEELLRIENTGKYWTEFYQATGRIFSEKPTDLQRESVIKWTDQWKMPMSVLQLAVEQMKNNGVKPSIKYLDKIVSDWYSEGAVTPEKVDAYLKKCEERKMEKSGTAKRKAASSVDSNKGASYDIDKAVEQSVTQSLKVKKREKR